MTAALAVLAALGEACCAAIAGTLQHTTARRGRGATWTATGQLRAFAHHQLSQWLWWLSLGVQAASLALHATALQLGSLTLVQPVVATVVVLALPLNHRVQHRRIGRAELAWAACATLALAGFITAAAPRSHVAPIPANRLMWPFIAGACATVLCMLLARSQSPRAAAVALGTGAGIAFSVEAALLQTLTRPLLRHPLSTLAGPAPYGLIVAGAAGVFLTQLAYRAGPMRAALPAIVTVNPVVSVLIDHLAVPRAPQAGPGTTAAAAVALAALLVAVGALARMTGPGRRLRPGRG